MAHEYNKTKQFTQSPSQVPKTFHSSCIKFFAVKTLQQQKPPRCSAGSVRFQAPAPTTGQTELLCDFLLFVPAASQGSGHCRLFRVPANTPLIKSRGQEEGQQPQGHWDLFKG